MTDNNLIGVMIKSAVTASGVDRFLNNQNKPPQPLAKPQLKPQPLSTPQQQPVAKAPLNKPLPIRQEGVVNMTGPEYDAFKAKEDAEEADWNAYYNKPTSPVAGPVKQQKTLPTTQKPGVVNLNSLGKTSPAKSVQQQESRTPALAAMAAGHQAPAAAPTPAAAPAKGTYATEGNNTVGKWKPNFGEGRQGLFKNKYYYDKENQSWKSMNEYQGEIELDAQNRPIFGKNMPAMATKSENGQFMLDPRARNRFKMMYRDGNFHAKSILSDEQQKMRKMLKLPAGTALGAGETVVGMKDGKALTSTGATYDIWANKHMQEAQDKPFTSHNLMENIIKSRKKSFLDDQQKRMSPAWKEYQRQKALANDYSIGGWLKSLGNTIGNEWESAKGYYAKPSYEEGQSFKDFERNWANNSSLNSTLKRGYGGATYDDWYDYVNPLRWGQSAYNWGNRQGLKGLNALGF